MMVGLAGGLVGGCVDGLVGGLLGVGSTRGIASVVCFCPLEVLHYYSVFTYHDTPAHCQFK